MGSLALMLALGVAEAAEAPEDWETLDDPASQERRSVSARPSRPQLMLAPMLLGGGTLGFATGAAVAVGVFQTSVPPSTTPVDSNAYASMVLGFGGGCAGFALASGLTAWMAFPSLGLHTKPLGQALRAVGLIALPFVVVALVADPFLLIPLAALVALAVPAASLLAASPSEQARVAPLLHSEAESTYTGLRWTGRF